jgi:outer membrane protein TolC
MKIPRLPVILVCLFSTALCLVARGGENVLTPEQVFPQLDGILKAAVTQSPRVLARSIDLELAEYDRITARAGLLPSVGGYYNDYETSDKRGDLSSRINLHKVYYNFSITQPVFYWGERRNNYRVSQIRQHIAQRQFREAYRLLAQEIRNVYCQIVLNKLRARKAEEYLVYANNQLKQGEERLAKKVLSEAQIFGIRNDAERAAIAAERAAFELENSKATLARLSGLPPLNDADIPDTMPAIPLQDEAVQKLLAGFLAQRDLRAVEAENFRNSIQIEKFNLKNQRTRLRPKLSLVAGRSLDEQSYTLNVAQKYKVESDYIGLGINWQVFDGFAARAGVRSSLARLRQMEIDYRALTDRLAQTAQSQARLASFAGRSCVVNDRYLDSGESNVKAKKEDFSRGVISEEELTLARIGLYDVQINTYYSRIDYLNQLTEFLGTVVEDPVLKNLDIK